MLLDDKKKCTSEAWLVGQVWYFHDNEGVEEHLRTNLMRGLFHKLDLNEWGEFDVRVKFFV